MRKANIESYIPRALEVLNGEFEDEISKTYVGYISAFGVSLVQIGLLPTVALHEKDERKIINILVLSVYDATVENMTLLEYIVSRPESEHDQIKEKLKEIAVALKLCMRTFKLTKGGSDE